MMKLCILGGGSVNTPLFVRALSNRQNGISSELCLFDIDETNLKIVADYCRFLAGKLDLNISITESSSIERAVHGATHILNMMRVGGAAAILADRRQLALSGIAGHAASYAEACRIVPVLMQYLPVIEKTAPHAMFINFSNPVSIICNAIARRFKINFIGLCYHATMMKHNFAALLGSPPDELDIRSFGINHFSWVTDVRVTGKSRFGELVDAIIRKQLKEYNYDCIKPLNVIPIGHAFSAYRKGGRFFAPEKGKRGNAADILYKFFVSKSIYVRYYSGQRRRMLNAYQNKDYSTLETLSANAPWYVSCVVPFLEDLIQRSARKHYLLTVRSAREPGVKNTAYEVPCEVADNRIVQQEVISSMPEFIIKAVRNITDSENLMIRAIVEKSPAIGLQALLIHPHVYSQKCAVRFCDFYFG